MSSNILRSHDFIRLQNSKQKAGNGAEVKKQKATGLFVDLRSQRAPEYRVSKWVQMMHHSKI